MRHAGAIHTARIVPAAAPPKEVALIGFDERGASILDDAQTATAAIHRTAAERLSGTRLMVVLHWCGRTSWTQ